MNRLIAISLLARYWPLIVYVMLVGAWIGWCLYDASAGMFAPAVAALSIPAALCSAPRIAAIALLAAGLAWGGETVSPVNPVIIRQTCECGGEYKPTGVCLTSYPAQYPHTCDKCGKGATFAESYPLIRYERPSPTNMTTDLEYYLGGVYTNMVVSDDTIRELCEQGRVCAVVGHVWDERPMLQVEGDRFVSEGLSRVCRICKRREIKREEWRVEE